MSRFADRVRADPIVGFAPDGDGARTRVHLDEDALVQIFSAGYYFPGSGATSPPPSSRPSATTRPDPAARRRDGTVDIGGEDPPSSSEALYLAVICHDYPELWDLDTPIEDRPAEVERRLADTPTARSSLHRSGVDRHRLRGLARVPALAVARGRIQPTRPAPTTRTYRRSS